MLRQRRKPRTRRPSSSSKPRAAIGGGRFHALLELFGIRALRREAPPTPAARREARIDLLLAALLLLPALSTRFYRLALPAKIVFDEWHFAAFVDNYLSGRYLFDIHPPLGKLTLAAAARLGAYQDVNYTFSHLGQPYGPLVYYPQRALSASVGSLIPSVLYLTCRELPLSRVVSATVAAMPLFDMLLCVESRLILTDSQLIFFIQASLLCALKLWRAPKSTPRRYIWLVLTALSGACAISTKWTAVVAPAMIGLVSVSGAVFPREGRLDVLEMVGAGALALGVYAGTFWVHFWLLPLSGPGDAFMRPEFQATLVGSRHEGMVEAGAGAPGFVENFKYLNWEMLRANSAIEQRHHWESKVYEWLYNARGILYLDETEADGKRRQIYLISNPVLTVVSGAGVVIGAMLLLGTPVLLRRARARARARAGGGEAGEEAEEEVRRRAGRIGFFLCGWVLNLVPYVGVRRCTFLYHVLPALQMASVLAGCVLDMVPRGMWAREMVCATVVAGMGWGFWYWRAWTYALGRSVEEIERLRWMPRWN